MSGTLSLHIYKKQFDEVNEEFFEKAVEMYTEEVERGLQYAVEEHGVEEIHLSEEETERWHEALEPLIDEPHRILK